MSIVVARHRQSRVSSASRAPRARSRLRARRAAPLAPNRFSADLLVRPMCTKGSSSYASSSFARARSAARSRPSDPSFALDDAAATARARARDAGGARRERADGVARRRARRRSRGRHRARAVHRTREARGGVRTRHRVAKWRFAFFTSRRGRRGRLGDDARVRRVGLDPTRGPENNTSNSIVTTCLRVRLSRRAPSHGRRELRFAQANRFRCHFYEFICTYVSDSALEIYYLRWRQSNRFVVAACTHIC